MTAQVMFAHDHRFVDDDGTIFSTGSFPYAVLRRYVFDNELTVVCRMSRKDRHGQRLAESSGPGVSFVPMPNMRSLRGLSRASSVTSSLDKLVAEHRLVVARLPSVLGLMACRSAARRGVRAVVEVVGNGLEANLRRQGKAAGAIAGVAEHLATKAAVEQASDVIYITSDYLQAVYPTRGRSYVCSNVDLERMSESNFTSKSDSFLDASRTLRMGLVGSLDVRYKGHEVALRALQVARELDPGLRLRLELVGSGDGRWLTELAGALGIESLVAQLGPIASGEPMRAWQDSIDLMLQPSSVEAQGRAILEAMSRGCAVLSTKVGGIPEILDSRVLHEPNDYESLGQSIRDFATYRSLLYDQASHNWQSVRRFDRQTLESQRRAIFTRLLADV